MWSVRAELLILEWLDLKARRKFKGADLTYVYSSHGREDE
jgi:hypothetical protein